MRPGQLTKGHNLPLGAGMLAAMLLAAPAWAQADRSQTQVRCQLIDDLLICDRVRPRRERSADRPTPPPMVRAEPVPREDRVLAKGTGNPG